MNKNTNKQAIAVLGVIIIIVLLVVVGFNPFAKAPVRPNFPTEVTNPNPDSAAATPSTQIKEGWNILTNDTHQLAYPPEAKAESRENNESLVYFMGQKQIDSGRTQTELFDGYSFRVGTIETETKSLKELAQLERDNAEQHCISGQGSISPLTEVSVGGQTGFQYTGVGCYLDYTETITAYQNSFYRVSQSYVGTPEDQENYQQITEEILSSFEFK